MGKLIDLDKYRKNSKRLEENDKTPWIPGYEVKSFTLDMEGLEKLSASEGKDIDEMFKILPDQLINDIINEVSGDFAKSDNVSKVHDDCFEIQLLAEQYPDKAEYISSQVQKLTKQLILYITNKR